MKIRTKILTAVLAVATAFSCALTASAWDDKANNAPTVEFGNSAMPGKTNSDGTATATLTLKSSDFADVTGAKLTVTLPNTMTLEDAKVTGNGSWVKDTDYKVVKGVAGTITLVNVFNVGDAEKNLSVYLELTVSNDVGNFDGNITVSGEFADTKVDKVYTYSDIAREKLNLTRTETSYNTVEEAQTAITTPDEGYFIPVGGVYTVSANGEVKYYSKADNGDTFDFGDTTDDITVLKCPLPAPGEDVTTFGYTDKDGDQNSSKEYERYNGIQFGAYTNNNTEGNEFGTLIIMGDYTAFKNCYTDKTDEELLKLIISRYDTRVTDGTIKLGEPYTFKKGDQRITVKKVKQTAHMWQSGANLQYAVRLYKLVEGRSYTGVAYSFSNNTYNFSKEIQTRVNPYSGKDY